MISKKGWPQKKEVQKYLCNFIAEIPNKTHFFQEYVIISPQWVGGKLTNTCSVTHSCFFFKLNCFDLFQALITRIWHTQIRFFFFFRNNAPRFLNFFTSSDALKGVSPSDRQVKCPIHMSKSRHLTDTFIFQFFSICRSNVYKLIVFQTFDRYHTQINNTWPMV